MDNEVDQKIVGIIVKFLTFYISYMIVLKYMITLFKNYLMIIVVMLKQ